LRFQYANFIQLPVPSEAGCKGNNLFSSRKLYFKINPALLSLLYAFQFIALSSERVAKVEKITTPANGFACFLSE